MPNSRFPFQQSHTSLTHPSLPTEWHVSFITGPCQSAGGHGQLWLQRFWMCPGREQRQGAGTGAPAWAGGMAPSLRSLCAFTLAAELPCSASWRFSPPVFFLSLSSFLFFPRPFFFFSSLAVGTNWLTRIIQAAPACWGLCKWIWELLVSHDSNVHYWRWMFLKKRLMMDIRLIVPFIILNII